jgi:hypothetical protein
MRRGFGVRADGVMLAVTSGVQSVVTSLTAMRVLARSTMALRSA